MKSTKVQNSRRNRCTVQYLAAYLAASHIFIIVAIIIRMRTNNY